MGTMQGGGYSWWLFGMNGEKVAWAGESFANRSIADRAARLFKAGASSAAFEVYEVTGRNWRWRALRSGDKVAVCAEPFPSKEDAERAVETVMKDVADAVGP